MVALFYNEDGIRAIDELLKECKRSKGNEKEKPFFLQNLDVHSRSITCEFYLSDSLRLLFFLFFSDNNQLWEIVHMKNYTIESFPFRELLFEKLFPSTEESRDPYDQQLLDRYKLEKKS